MEETVTLESEDDAERQTPIPIVFDARIERLVRASTNDERSGKTEGRTSQQRERARYGYD